ncbi:hypothetical protein Tco_0883857, partial [Tanacetum coccineum]
ADVDSFKRCGTSNTFDVGYRIHGIEADEVKVKLSGCHLRMSPRILLDGGHGGLTQESVTRNLNDRGEIGFRLGDFKAKDNYMYVGVGIAELGKTVAAPSALVRPSANNGKGSKRKALPLVNNFLSDAITRTEEDQKGSLTKK